MATAAKLGGSFPEGDDFDRANPQSKGNKRAPGVTERKNEIDRLGARLDPEVRSWVKNVIVPAMVREYVAEHEITNTLAEPIAAVPQCEENVRLSAEGIQ